MLLRAGSREKSHIYQSKVPLLKMAGLAESNRIKEKPSFHLKGKVTLPLIVLLHNAKAFLMQHIQFSNTAVLYF